MNIIYIHTHDTGRYISPYGYNIPTPNLQSFAEQSVLFRKAFCAGPTCSPSRASLLTGTCPHNNGMIGLAHRGFKLKNPKQHLASFLAENGYETTLCGIQHEGGIKALGYTNHIVSEKKHKNGMFGREWDFDNAELAAMYLKEKGKQKDKPFFLSFGMFNTHRPYPKSDENIEINPGFVLPPANMYDNEQTRLDMAEYCLSAKIADDCVGTVLNAVKESGLEDETVIFFTTDHGIAFPNMKCNLYDEGIGVSLIIRVPKMKNSFQTDALVSHLDVFPTICDLLNLEKPNYLEGHSLLPILNRQTEKIRDEIFSEVTYHAAYEPMRCVRTERYKLIKFFDENENIVLSNIDDGHSKDFLLENGLKNKKRMEKTMLFDLYFDSSERINLINSPDYKKIGEHLNLLLDNWMIKTNDPLLNGKPQNPTGSIVNSSDCISASEEKYEL